MLRTRHSHRTAPAHAIVAAACVLLGACAATPGVETFNAAAPGTSAQGGTAGYTLTQEELALDCKKLTGRMQVRILQIRDYDPNSQTSGVARTMQSGAITVFGGSTHGSSPDSTYARDRAVLEAYNRQLRAKGCNTFDLEAELKPKPVKETPAPIAKK